MNGNDELGSSLTALRVAFQMLRPSLVSLIAQFDSVFKQPSPTDNIDDEAS